MAFVPLAGSFQLVATLGPASLGRAGELAEAGATAFRLNASHLTSESLEQALRAARAAAPGLPIVVDLQGAKMRVGDFAPFTVKAGERLVFTAVGTAGTVPLPHPELFPAAHAGDTLTGDDGKLRFRVLAAGPERLEVEALVEATVRPRKGVNLLEHPVALARLNPADEAFCRLAAGFAPVCFAFSFMLDGREAGWLRELAPDAPVLGKVERQEAVQNLERIAERVDAIWICRGDLGEQLGPVALARFVHALDPRSLRVPVLMAGQVLEHLTEHPFPTRSELCHLYDLAARGYAGFVLSDETAIGRDPVGAVARAAALLAEFAG